jgi:transposase
VAEGDAHESRTSFARRDPCRRARLTANRQSHQRTTGKGYTAAAREAGYQSGDSSSQLVERFNQHGLAALQIAAGRGRKETYTQAQRERIVQELQREPNRGTDMTATWSLKTLERSLRQAALPTVGKTTIQEVLQEAGCWVLLQEIYTEHTECDCSLPVQLRLPPQTGWRRM